MFERLLARTALKLENAGIPYMVKRGQAVLLHGEPRLTRDIDITVGISGEELGRILGVVSGLRFRILPDDAEAFVKKTMVLPVLHPASGIRIDFIFSYSPYARQAIGRARGVELGGKTVRFATAEDLVIHKVFAGRERDIEDARLVLLKNPSLDVGYIAKWLREFDAALNEDFASRFGGLLS